MTVKIREDVSKRLIALADLLQVSPEDLVNSIVEHDVEQQSTMLKGSYVASTAPPLLTPAPQATSEGRRRGRLADQIREHAVELVKQAKARGEKETALRAGDVHKALDLRNRLPAVCAALGSDIFAQMANVERLGSEGPANGSNAVFRYRL